MALTRQKKEAVVSELENLLSDSKLTVIAKYQGTPVKSMQKLRLSAATEGTHLRVAKNRLFKRALSSSQSLKALKINELRGQLLYAFNPDDEVAPARSLADFAKVNPQIEFVAGITADGQLLTADTLNDLASLPTKDVLRAQLIGTLSAPASSFVNVLAGNLRGLLNVMHAYAENLTE